MLALTLSMKSRKSKNLGHFFSGPNKEVLGLDFMLKICMFFTHQKWENNGLLHQRHSNCLTLALLFFKIDWRRARQTKTEYFISSCSKKFYFFTISVGFLSCLIYLLLPYYTLGILFNKPFSINFDAVFLTNNTVSVTVSDFFSECVQLMILS